MGDSLKPIMYIELTREKFIAMLLIVTVLASGSAFFVLANNAWNLLPGAGHAIARSESGCLYWLFYGSSATEALSTPAGNALSVPVLAYHGEDATSEMPLSVFVEHMRALKADGWRTITMKQYDAWAQGEIQLPDKSFLLTFDDGRKDTYYQFDPVLEDMEFHGVMFVITGLSFPDDGKRSSFYLNETELTRMIASGRWELESHGHADHGTFAVQTTTDLTQSASTTTGHYLTNLFWNTEANRFETSAEFRARVRNDQIVSKRLLEDTFGITVDAFAYPFNDFGQNTVNFPGSKNMLDSVVPKVYTYAFYQTWRQNGDTFNYPRTNNGPGTTAYMEKRVEPPSTWSGKDLIDVLDDGRAKPMPYQSSTFGTEWVETWGDATVTSSGVVLFALPTTSGASAFLNGSGWWGDYYFAATVLWQKSRSVSLIARNLDDRHYAYCDFTPTQVLIKRHTEDGAQTTLTRASATLSTEGTVSLGVGVSGNRMTCYENGTPIVSAVVSMPTRGGIGIEVWDKTPGTARSTVTSVSVTHARE